jgi:ABC-type uncharacterized transport system fused permease/ATPase subunit
MDHIKIQARFMSLTMKCTLYQQSFSNLVNIGEKILPIVSNLFRVFIFVGACEKIEKIKNKKKKFKKNLNEDLMIVEFNNVKFKTPAGKYLCNNLDFRVKVGDNLLIMGKI